MNGQAALHQEAKFLKASDVANIMQISTTSAYRIIKRLNAELQNQTAKSRENCYSWQNQQKIL